MTTWDSFMSAVEKVVDIIAPFIKSKKGKPLQVEIAKKILQWEEKEHPAVQFILDHPKMKKTPLYFLHRDELSRKDRLRKQDFLALVEYLRNKPEEEEEKFYRSSRTYAIFTNKKSGGKGNMQKIEMRVWMYHTEEIKESDLDDAWSDAYANAVLNFGSNLISNMEEYVADELNEEIDEDEYDAWEEWQRIIWFNDIAYSIEGWRIQSLDGDAV